MKSSLKVKYNLILYNNCSDSSDCIDNRDSSDSCDSCDEEQFYDAQLKIGDRQAN